MSDLEKDVQESYEVQEYRDQILQIDEFLVKIKKFREKHAGNEEKQKYADMREKKAIDYKNHVIFMIERSQGKHNFGREISEELKRKGVIGSSTERITPEGTTTTVLQPKRPSND